MFYGKGVQLSKFCILRGKFSIEREGTRHEGLHGSHIKSPDVKRNADLRQTEKAAKKKGPGNQEFIKTLESAVNQMQEAAQGTRVPAEKADATAIKQEVNAANENYAKMMRARLVVSQLYHNMNPQKNEK